MGLFKRMRSRPKLEHDEKTNGHGTNGHIYYPSQPLPGRDFIQRLPAKIVQNIFEYVCPHVLDRSYDISENSQVGESCMLCDLRDLAHCAGVRRDWYQLAQELLYTSIRIDAVHYCELEEIFAVRRRRKSRHGNIEDVPAVRLRMLANTLQTNPWLGAQVQLLKLPYMTRETARQDLARTLSKTPNLRYADLPEGFYNGDASCHILRQEVFANCPQIRKMKYHQGAEQFFQFLPHRNWQALEGLELKKLRIEPTALRTVLACLPVLRELKVINVPSFTDTIFNVAPTVPNFPPLQTLILERCPKVTADGLNNYLDRSDTRDALTTLSLTSCNISIPQLHLVLWNASNLKTLTVVITVAQSLPLDAIPPLTSLSLRTLHFEITPTEDQLHTGLPKPSDSYYNYVTSSLLSNSLPALRNLYVRDPGLPDALLLAPPVPQFAGGGGGPPRGFSQPLEVYTKGLDDAEWVFNAVAPEDPFSAVGGGGRPMSTYSMRNGGQWGNEARRSVIVGNGTGGFLAMPSAQVRPDSSSSMKAPQPGWGARPMSIARPHSSHTHQQVDDKRGSWFGHGNRTNRGSTASRQDLWR
ncbi:hypothetical protein EJ08DRAFT_691183 [Tothia fuscella]|uniref:F-box domain-containing protein n=1 Tax=Tothia fuscella TaxID=1048955 RepID=A0A9P4P253_9PEZI|nr:hypothetical protein EJ08DRAFT_691183 [Tothia fuscella]